MAWCRFLCAWGVLLLLPSAAASQELLTLDAAVQKALAQNASLRAARAGADEAGARVTEARSAFFPRISITESWQRGDQPVFVFSSLLSARRFAAANFAIEALNHPDPIAFFQTTVGVEQILFDGGRVRSAATAAAFRRDAANASVDEAGAGVALAVTQAFGRLISARAARRASTEALAAAREDHARAERRRDAGMANDADVLTLAVHVADLQQRAIQADGDVAVAQAELNRLMGEPIEREVSIVEPSGVSTDAPDTHDLPALFAEADAARPELKRAAALERSADAARRAARGALVPQVAAQAGFDVSGTRVNDRASSWIVGGELRWTFSLGGAEMAAKKAAAMSLLRERAEEDAARAAVHVDVISAVRRLESARARAAVARTAVQQARESQRIVRDRFDAGITPVNDVLRASASLLEAEGNQTAALVDTVVSIATLRRALGRTP